MDAHSGSSHWKMERLDNQRKYQYGYQTCTVNRLARSKTLVEMGCTVLSIDCKSGTLKFTGNSSICSILHNRMTVTLSLLMNNRMTVVLSLLIFLYYWTHFLLWTTKDSQLGTVPPGLVHSVITVRQAHA